MHTYIYTYDTYIQRELCGQFRSEYISLVRIYRVPMASTAESLQGSSSNECAVFSGITMDQFLVCM